MIKLPRLPYGWKDTPDMFERYWDQTLTQIEASVNGILAAQAAAVAANAAATTAQAAAVTANTAATAASTAASTANTAATAVTAQSNIASSYVTGCTITATDAGANVTVTISAHTRVYGDGTSVAVSGGSLTALAYSTTYFIYYDQASRLGGAVTYVATTSSSTAAQLGSRHVVGSALTPAALAAPVSGRQVDPPGSGAIR